MPSARRLKGGLVAGVYIGQRMGAGKHQVAEIDLTFEGVSGDAHAGMVRAAGPREPGFKRGTRLANLRQVSLVSVEELDTIAQRLSIDRIDPSWLAANIALQGAGPITDWPRGTLLRFPSGATVYVTDVNSPCSLAAKLIAWNGGYTERQIAGFVRNAVGRRGLVGLVYAPGTIRTGDALERLE